MLKRKEYIEDFIIIGIVILFMNFFSLTIIDEESPSKSTLIYVTGWAMLGYPILKFLSNKPVDKKPLDKLLFFFILSMFLSVIMSDAYWQQPVAASLKSYCYYYIYALYFVMVYLEVTPQRVERIFKILFFASLVVFAIDLVTFPNPLFSYRSEERRDGITIFFYGQGFTFLGAFYYLNEFFRSKKVIGLFFFMLAFGCLFFLTQSRMNLLALVLGFFFMLITSNFKRKYLFAFLLLLGAFGFYLNSSVFKGIKQESADQAENAKEDVRLLALNFYLTELQGGVPTVLFGNGIPARGSDLSLQTSRGVEMGYWTADLGLTGIFSYFGLAGVVIWILFFYKTFMLEKTNRSPYLKGYFLTLLTTAFVAYSIFDPGYMPATILVLFLVRSNNESVNEPEMEG